MVQRHYLHCAQWLNSLMGMASLECNVMPMTVRVLPNRLIVLKYWSSNVLVSIVRWVDVPSEAFTSKVE